MITTRDAIENPFCFPVWSFIQGLVVLSETPSRQKLYLASDLCQGEYDEVLLEFGYAWDVIERRVTNERIHAEVRVLMDLIHGLDKDDMWDDAYFESSADWHAIRVKAKLILLMVVSAEDGAFIRDMSADV